MSYQIALDGPAGVGKSTIAKNLSEKLSFIYVDTGALYRALSVYFLDRGLLPSDEEGIRAVLPDISVEIRYEGGEQHVLVNGTDVTKRLRTKEVSNMASCSSQYRAVREKLLETQRELAARYNVIMDGRDIGTVILPDATLKVYLTAEPRIRAERRYNQLREQNELSGETLESIEQDIRERDFRDENREHAPLKQAKDAVLLDTSHLTIREVEERIESLLRERI